MARAAGHRHQETTASEAPEPGSREGRRPGKPREAKTRKAAPKNTTPDAVKTSASKPARKAEAERKAESLAAKIENCENYGEQCREAAEAAGLVYVSDEAPGIARKKSGTGWRYVGPDGKTVKDYWDRKRIEKIGVPPAYSDVWICPDPNGHIQATGRDAKGRKQYRYHAKWTEARDAAKYGEMITFGQVLPLIRQRVDEDMRRHGMPREKVLATVVTLLERTLIRVGNEDYAKDNKSYGLTTLRNRHVEIEGSTLRFDFKGKSGKMWNLDLKDRRVAKVVRSIQELPGQHLFQYLDDEGHRQPVSSSDVNAYLHEITGRDITAKDFRTWAGTVLASMALREYEAVDSQSRMKKNVKAAVESVAKRLGNTPTICRKCYIHPQVLTAYLDGNLLQEIKEEAQEILSEHADQLKPEEVALLGLLTRRIQLDVKAGRVA